MKYAIRMMSFLIFMFSASLFGQVDVSQSVIVNNGTNIALPREYLRNNLLGNNQPFPANTKGSPYLNDQPLMGFIIANDSIKQSAKLQYNIYSDEIEIVTETQREGLLKRPYLSAEINGLIFKIERFLASSGVQQGYVVPLYEGDSFNLYKRYVAIFKDGTNSGNSYQKDKAPSFIRETNYYYSSSSEPILKELSNKKKVLEKLFSAEEGMAFLKEKKSKLEEQELLTFFELLNE
jgi:hypothetical protein